MIVGIDASNISSGGGLTHLIELMIAADPKRHGFSRVVLWAAQRTLDQIEDRFWLSKRTEPVLQSGFLRRALWQRNRLGKLAREEQCDLLFVPGGSFSTDFEPVVTMSRNLLPFEWKELRRYGWSVTTLKMLGLRWTQTRSYRRAAGTIFLTRYAKETVLRRAGVLRGATAIIPHGLALRFSCPPRTQQSIGEYSPKRPFKLLYVSTIDHYKHQWLVAEAVAALRAEGLPLSIDFVGTAEPRALERLSVILDRVDPERRHLRHVGAVDYRTLHEHYAQADGFVFASSCENLPNILLEGMASGLPIACSRLGPMPEILGGAGVYFDPEQPNDIAAAIRALIKSAELRSEKAQEAFDRSQKFSWARCADATWAFFAEVCRTPRSGRSHRPGLDG